MKWIICSVALFFAGALSSDTKQPPNVLIFFVDDMGYGDLGCQGNDTVRSPNIDALAADGVRFTQWLSGESICTPSRGALLTGRLPIRLGLSSGIYYSRVFQPLSPGGLPHSEHTIAEALKERGYKTHLTGKWHLGIGEGGKYLPTTHGFDSFYGMGITNVQTCMPGKAIYTQASLYGFIWDNSYHIWLGAFGAIALSYFFDFISFKSFWMLLTTLIIIFLLAERLASFFTLFNPQMCILHHGQDILQQPIELYNLTQRKTANAKAFISKSVESGDKFFLYMSYIKLHTALYSNNESKIFDEVAHPEYKYVNNINELDWSVGSIVQHLKDIGAYENTLIWFSSDNGPFLERGVEGGSKSFLVEENGQRVLKKLRGGKAQIWEGGYRVPGIGVYKSLFPSKTVTNEPVSTMDIFPTTLAIVDSLMPEEKLLTYTENKPHTIVDGKNILPLIKSLDTKNPIKSPHSEMIHYCGETLSAVRIDGRYKAYFYTPNFAEENDETCRAQSSCSCEGNFVTKHDPPLLFDLTDDIEETHVLTKENFSGYNDIMRRVDEAIFVHEKSIVDFPNNPSEVKQIQLPWLISSVCCNFPYSCSCDKETDAAKYI